MSEELGTRTGNRRWFEMSQKIEQVVKAEKKLNANVDFYSATTYYALGIPVDLFTPVFAVSRISGWTAHVLEQYANNRLIRPRAEYTGPGLPPDIRAARIGSMNQWRSDRHTDGSSARSKFFHHRPHRSRQVDAGRSPSRGDRRAAAARDGSAGARLDGPRARARHHHQGASRPAELHGQGRADLRRST